MKRKIGTVLLISAVIFGSSMTAFAETPERKLPAVMATGDTQNAEETADGMEDTGAADPKAGQWQVARNTVFTTSQQMQQYMGTSDPEAWSVVYLPEVEQYYWNFSAPGEQEKKEMSMNLVSNSYQNLEMFLDNGYLLDYNELAAYAADYLVRKGEEDAYYKILTDCLNNPYLLNKPEAAVTDTTYNGRDYSAVFDPDYYYDANPDLQATVGFNPPELLRHFVEIGITEGRRGNAGFDLDTYIAYTDGEIALEKAGIQAPGPMPAVARYSNSRANYYGKLLGHYDYSAVFGPGEEEIPADAAGESGADW